MPNVSIIIPTLNEAENLPLVLEDIKTVMKAAKQSYELIIVDGYSKDATVEIAKKAKARVFYDNVGKGSALRKGMLESRSNVIVMMDADCSHRGIELRLLVEAIESGYDVCMGSRFIQGGGTADMPVYRRLGNKSFVSIVNAVWSMNYSDLCYGYRAFSRKAVSALLPLLKSDGFGIETEISIKSAKLGLRVLEIPSYEKSRLHGKGNLRSLSDGWKILKTIKKEI
ncbi:MAG: glycosyltransferase family 2 protein [Candidatus Aenigmatarchaeota archaeon]